MRIAFRAAASLQAGTGHLVRSLALADELRARGADVAFVIADQFPFAAQAVSAHGFRAHAIPASPADSEQDAEQTLRQLDGRYDWMVADHYGLGESWECRIRIAAAKILAIDDLADRPHDCDLLLDQNFRPAAEQAYHGLVARSTGLLVGPRYALLGKDYRARQPRPRDGVVRRVLVSYGGTDASNETMKAVEAIAGLGPPAPEVDVAIGTAYPHGADLRKALGRIPRVTLHTGRAHLADLMEAADLALGAGGTTTWERLCSGLPSLITTTAENQVSSTRALAEAGYVSDLGPAESVTVEMLRDAVVSRIGDPAALRKESLRGRTLVDGAGTLRVVDAMLGIRGAVAELRPAAAADEDLLLAWANDPEVRRWAFHPDPIAPRIHRDWLRAKLADSQTRIWIFEEDGVAKGQIRCERAGAEVRVHYSVAAGFRGQGLARAMLLGAVAQAGRIWPGVSLRAEVVPGNARSERALKAAGFADAPALRRDTGSFVRLQFEGRPHG